MLKIAHLHQWGTHGTRESYQAWLDDKNKQHGTEHQLPAPLPLIITDPCYIKEGWMLPREKSMLRGIELRGEGTVWANNDKHGNLAYIYFWNSTTQPHRYQALMNDVGMWLEVGETFCDAGLFCLFPTTDRSYYPYQDEWWMPDWDNNYPFLFQTHPHRGPKGFPIVVWSSLGGDATYPLYRRTTPEGDLWMFSMDEDFNIRYNERYNTGDDGGYDNGLL